MKSTLFTEGKPMTVKTDGPAVGKHITVKTDEPGADRIRQDKNATLQGKHKPNRLP